MIKLKTAFSVITRWFSTYVRIIEIILFLAAIASTFWSGWHIRGLSDIKENQEKLIDQRNIDSQHCAELQTATKGANDAFIKNLTDTNDQCVAALRLRATCVPIGKDVNGGAKLATPRPKHDDTGFGLDSAYLRWYETECKATQSDYHTCIEFGHQCAKQHTDD